MGGAERMGGSFWGGGDLDWGELTQDGFSAR